MKRTAFLTAGAAAALGGCSRRQGASVLPALSPSAATRAAAGTPAAPIPADVLARPIIGEARRFDGATVPPGWLKMEGQTLRVADYQRLFAILGKGGSRDPATFILPAPPQGWILAVAGVYPGAAGAVAALHRGTRVKDGVAVDGAVVRPAPLLPLQLRRPPIETVPEWYPGTPPTAAEIAAQLRDG